MYHVALSSWMLLSVVQRGSRLLVVDTKWKIYIGGRASTERAFKKERGSTIELSEININLKALLIWRKKKTCHK